MECPDCGKVVQVGMAEHKNLEAHRVSKACKTASRKHANGAQGAQSNRPDQVIEAFFKPQAPFIPSTVSTPPPIHPGKPFMLASENYRGPLADPAPLPVPAHPMAKSPGLQSMSITGQLRTQNVPDKKAISLLRNLEAAVKQIHSDTPSATPEHQLNVFSVDPRTCVAEPGGDNWLILNQMMTLLLRWGEQEMAALIPKLLNHGTYGLVLISTEGT